MANRKAPSKGLMERAGDTGLFGMCTDCVTIDQSQTPSTTPAVSNLSQEVFQQSRGLGGGSSDPVDGSGLIHVIWGVEYLCQVANFVPNGSIATTVELFLSRDRDGGGGVGANLQVEQSFASFIHGTLLDFNTTFFAVVNTQDSWGDRSKQFWFNQPYVAIAPYYLEGSVVSVTNNATQLSLTFKLSCYVYYQLKRVDGRTYQYLMEKYTSGFGGMKSRARELS